MTIAETLKQISTLREIKGKEKETYELIEKTRGETKEKDVLAKLYWEESLVAQHEIMFNGEDKTVVEKALKRMESSALAANKIIEENELNKMQGGSYRFIGNVYRYKKDYKKAQEYFELAMSEYQNNNDKGTLEIRGFLAYCLIQNGETENGIKLGLETFDAFEKSDKGIVLKHQDYFTWAVWRSGIVPRLVEALLDTKSSFDKETILKYLDKSEEILRKPEGPITWGDTAFQLRLDEIEKARKNLSN